MSTPRILTSLPILLRPDGRRAVLFDAGAAGAPMPDDPTKPKMMKAIGYRQTKLPASKGGTANANGFRVRNEGMRALGRSFRGQPFVTGHNKGDVRARGGTIRDSYTEELTETAELAIVYEIEVVADWALEGLANGTIDRFSFSIDPTGEIMCTAHDAPVWSTEDCWCFPGEMVELDDGQRVVAEWEFEDATGLELSAVNVPAVQGTGILATAGMLLPAGAPAAGRLVPPSVFMAQRLAQAGELAALCGRAFPAFGRSDGGGAPLGGFPRAAPPITMTACQPPSARGDQMTHEQMCQMLGLPTTATPAEVDAAFKARLTAANQAVAAELAAHVDHEIGRLRRERVVPDEVVASLRAAATGESARAAFDAQLRLVELAAPAVTAAAPVRPALQSDARPAAAGAAGQPTADGTDAFEANRANPELASMMRIARVTEADVRQHGARTFNVLANLGELSDATTKREASEAAARARKELL